MAIRDGFLGGMEFPGCPRCKEVITTKKVVCKKCGWKPGDMVLRGSPPPVKRKMPWE